MREKFIQEFYEKMPKSNSIVFINTKKTAAYLKDYLSKKGFGAEMLIGGTEAAERDRVMEGFRAQEFNTLLTTNVMGRGIDVPEVDIVINFDIP